MAGVFEEAVLTAKGIALLAKAQAGRCTIKLTKAATGDGSYSDGEALTNRTALKSKKQEFALITVTTQNQSNVYVKFIITNKQDTGNLKNGYYVKEVGIYAQDPDEGEILYALAVGVANQWDYMPAYNVYFCNQRVETVEQKVWIELVLQGCVTGCVIFFFRAEYCYR